MKKLCRFFQNWAFGTQFHYGTGAITHDLKSGHLILLYKAIGLNAKGKRVTLDTGYIQCDFNECEHVFTRMDASRDAFLGARSDLEAIRDMYALTLDDQLLSALLAATNALESYPENDEDGKHRLSLTQNTPGMIKFKLSQAVNEGFMSCAEQAALAAYWLKRRGYAASLISGTLCTTEVKNVDHVLVGIMFEKGMVFFDPSVSVAGKGLLRPASTPELHFVDHAAWRNFCRHGEYQESWVYLNNLRHGGDKRWFGFSYLPKKQSNVPFRNP